MRVHRFEATARIEPSQGATRIDRSRMQLVTLALCDAGPVIDPDGRERTRPEAVCHLAATEARELALELLCLAEQAEQLSDERSST